MFDYAKLKGKIKEKFNTQDNFAKAMGLSTVSMSNKLNNKIQWSQKEISKACVFLEIEIIDIPAYFFADKVKQP